MDTFIGTLSVDDMIELSRGEGMSSPKVTAGTACSIWWCHHQFVK